MTYTWKKIFDYDVAIDDETGKVHHAVDEKQDRTYWPYVAANDGWDNAVGRYTADQFRRKIKNGTAAFK
ncbi:hypothetical protein [Ruminococcus sp.]|uniref:hypothetical protein n=1 Tax=Ruminococcus sp. TaxID=41978 RepID=UPI001B6265B4|nr:hypothetical protein [Ruminococcus sp.]MBP5432867.1 hypothetical protein [Ruminococcus sp.]